MEDAFVEQELAVHDTLHDIFVRVNKYVDEANSIDATISGAISQCLNCCEYAIQLAYMEHEAEAIWSHAFDNQSWEAEE